MIRKTDWELPIPFAIVQWTDDNMYNKDKSEIVIFSNEKDYKNFLKEVEHDQEWAGRTVDTIFHVKTWFEKTWFERKKVKFEFDNHIENLEQLIDRLEGLRLESYYMMKESYIDPEAQKDFHALKIVINYLREIKE